MTVSGSTGPDTAGSPATGSGTPVLEVRDLRVEITSRSGVVHAVDGVSLEVPRGEAMGLVGESGSGKSMTLRACLGVLPAEAKVTSGQILLDGVDLVPMGNHDLNRIRGPKISMIFQEPMSALNPVMRVGPQIAEGPQVHLGYSRAKARERAIDLMRRVGIPDPERRYRAYPHEFSGGMRQRVMSAIALACDPEIILCDEPTTALDVTIQDQILRLLARLCRDSGASLVFVTHDLPVVAQICQNVAVMYGGQIVESGDVRDVLLDPRHPYTLGLVRSAPDFAALGMPVPPAMLVRRGGLQGDADAAAAAARRPGHRLPALRALPGGGRRRSGQPVTAAPAHPPASPWTLAPEEPLLAACGVSVLFPVGSQLAARVRHEERLLRAVDGVDLEIGRGEALALVGESGSGKSTLALTLAGLQPANGGEIRFGGRTLPARRSRADQRRIQMVFQDPYSSLNPRLTVGGILRELLRVHHVVPRTEVDSYSRTLLTLVGLGDEAMAAYPRQFSGGQRQRVAIARALALRPDILIADEPVSALDVSVQATILNLLRDLRAELGLSLLLISHNLAVVRHLCSRVAVMYLGRIIEVAPTEQLFSSPQHPYTRGLLEAIPRLTRDTSGSAPALRGDPPSPLRIPSGCRFRTRCPIAQERCSREDPALETGAPGHQVACHFAFGGAGAASERDQEDQP